MSKAYIGDNYKIFYAVNAIGQRGNASYYVILVTSYIEKCTEYKVALKRGHLDQDIMHGPRNLLHREVYKTLQEND